MLNTINSSRSVKPDRGRLFDAMVEFLQQLAKVCW